MTTGGRSGADRSARRALKIGQPTYPATPSARTSTVNSIGAADRRFLNFGGDGRSLGARLFPIAGLGSVDGPGSATTSDVTVEKSIRSSSPSGSLASIHPGGESGWNSDIGCSS